MSNAVKHFSQAISSVDLVKIPATISCTLCQHLAQYSTNMHCHVIVHVNFNWSATTAKYTIPSTFP